jgi:hypothetical protein
MVNGGPGPCRRTIRDRLQLDAGSIRRRTDRRATESADEAPAATDQRWDRPMLEAADRLEILDLVAKYSYGYDTLDWELMGSVWTDDATLVTGRGEQHSQAGIVEGFRARCEGLRDQGIQTRHYQTNTLLKETESRAARAARPDTTVRGVATRRRAAADADAHGWVPRRVHAGRRTVADLTARDLDRPRLASADRGGRCAADASCC